MKRTVLIIVTALICGTVLMTGCEKRNPNLEGFDDIIGCWANPTNEYDIYPKLVICYERVTNLPDDSPSIKFLNDGTLIERKMQVGVVHRPLPTAIFREIGKSKIATI